MQQFTKQAVLEHQLPTNVVQLAEMLDVKVIVGFSGTPGGTPQDTQPNWITYRWPPEYGQMLDWQWKEKIIPYWKEAAKFARDHGVHRLAFEMHPNFCVYNPRTLMKLREAVGEEIGAKSDIFPATDPKHCLSSDPRSGHANKRFEELRLRRGR